MAASPDHPAVKMWRDQYRLNLSRGRKYDIEVTVGDDLELWGKVLEFAKRRKWAPLKVQFLLSQFEEWQRDE